MTRGWLSLSLIRHGDNVLLEVGGFERMRPQPGNRFRFRLRARVVRASEAVREDSAVAGGRQTFFLLLLLPLLLLLLAGGRPGTSRGTSRGTSGGTSGGTS